MGGEAGLVERGEDVVELLTVAEGGGGGRQMTPNSSFSSLNWGDSPSQASSGVVTGREGAGPLENSIPLIDNSGLLVHDSTNKKVTSLTNEGINLISTYIHVVMFLKSRTEYLVK